MDIITVTALVLGLIGQILSQDTFHQQNDEPVLKYHVDHKGVVFVAICTTLGLIVLSVLLIVWRWRMKHSRERRQTCKTDEDISEYVKMEQIKGASMTPMSIINTISEVDNETEPKINKTTTLLEDKGHTQEKI